MASDAQATFRALSDPTRRGILRILAGGDQTIGQVAGHFDVTRPAIKKHLAILEGAPDRGDHAWARAHQPFEKRRFSAGSRLALGV